MSNSQLPWTTGKGQLEQWQGGMQGARIQHRSRQEEGRGRGCRARGQNKGGILRWLRQGQEEGGESRVGERVREGLEEARGRGKEAKCTTPTNAPNSQGPAYGLQA